MSVAPEQQVTTRMFARVLGPFLFIVPAAIAVRAPDMNAIAADFAEKPIWAWVLGALLLLSGIPIIAFHQFWKSPAAISISLLGWFLGLRGLALLFVPRLIVHGADMAMGHVPLVRVGFGVLSLLGLYLTKVGWIERDAGPGRDEILSER